MSFSHFSVNSGSFVYDIDLGLGSREWSPTKEELMVISARMHRIAEESLPLERLVVDLELAKEMFSDSIHKKKQIPSIAKNSPSGTVQEEFPKSQIAVRNFLNLLCIDNSNISFYTLAGIN